MRTGQRHSVGSKGAGWVCGWRWGGWALRQETGRVGRGQGGCVGGDGVGGRYAKRLGE